MENRIKIFNRIFATNNENEGLFVWNGNNWHQLVGTCDFDVLHILNTDYYADDHFFCI